MIVLQGTTLGKQSVEANLNDTDLIRKVLTGNFELQIPVDSAANGDRSVRLDLLLPDATTPNNGDPRVLGIDLHTLRLECSS